MTREPTQIPVRFCEAVSQFPKHVLNQQIAYVLAEQSKWSQALALYMEMYKVTTVCLLGHCIAASEGEEKIKLTLSVIVGGKETEEESTAQSQFIDSEAA